MARKVSSENTRKIRPALTPEARENQMIALAIDLAEQQLIDGTASSQVITHFLKLATVKEKLNNEKLEEENKLLRAKTEAIKAQQNTQEMYLAAIEAMKMYTGNAEKYDDPDIF